MDFEPSTQRLKDIILGNVQHEIPQFSRCSSRCSQTTDIGSDFTSVSQARAHDMAVSFLLTLFLLTRTAYTQGLFVVIFDNKNIKSLL